MDRDKDSLHAGRIPPSKVPLETHDGIRATRFLSPPMSAVGWLRQTFGGPETQELIYEAATSIWVRWLLIAGIIIETNYRVDYWSLSHILNTLYCLAFASATGYIHFRIRSKRRVKPLTLLALSAMDIAMLSFSVSLSGGFESRYFVLYYPMVAMFAWVFTSPYLGIFWATMVAVAYTTLCFTVGSGVALDMQDEKILFYRILGLYGVVGFVNILTRFERIRRRDALEREKDLHLDRMELSQMIHDTTGQSAYMIGLGIDTAIEQAGESNRDLIATLNATSALSKATMWELRRPIDTGLIFEGKELVRVLESHAATFTAITSIPASVRRSGDEPVLATETRVRLFSIAHNALTNAFRHARANTVEVVIDFEADRIRLAVTDDGVGLPDDYADRGHGFGRMKSDAERMGGRFIVESGGSQGGTTVICEVPRKR